MTRSVTTGRRRHAAAIAHALSSSRALALAFAATLLLSACASKPTVQRGEDAEVILGNLNRVDNSRVDLAYVDPLADFSRYRAVLLHPLDLDHVEIVQPGSSGSALNRFSKDWELTDGDRAELQAAYLDVMQEAVNASPGFAVAEGPGPDVLAVEAVLTRIAPNAPKDDMQSRPTARSAVYTQGAGSLSIAMALADGKSGEILALIKDTRDGDAGAWGMNNRVRNMAEVRRIFRFWGKRLSDGLDRIDARRQEADGE